MKSDQQRIDELESQVAGLVRQLQSVVARPATPLAVRSGWWLGKVYGSAITQGGSGTVRLWVRSQSAWRDSQIAITAYDFFLNVGDTIPANSKVRIDWYRNIWVITNAYCEADDSAGSILSPSVPIGGSENEPTAGSYGGDGTSTGDGSSSLIDDDEFNQLLTSGGFYEWGRIQR